GPPRGPSVQKELPPAGGSSPPPAALTLVGDKLFFTADDGTHGRELWVTDGTTAGTAMVADLNPTGDAFRPFTFRQPMLADVGGVLLFAIDDGAHGQELWRSHGTAAGTHLVKDIIPGAGDGIDFTDPLNFAIADGKLFFAANDGTHGSRLWMSDGTTEGTMQVSNLTVAIANPTQGIANVNGSLFF